MTDFQAPEKPPRDEESATSVLIVTGPTAGGKSGLALELADRLGGWIINADSMQVYRDLRVLTARPDAADEARVPHRLFGVLGAEERCSVGRWLDMAVAEIGAARAAGRLPILVGGTGMYLKALTEGLAPVPEVSAAATAEATALYDTLGGAAFAEILAERDPGAAATLPPGDRQRLIRAYAVARATGRTLADWQNEAPAGPALAAQFTTVLVLPPRDALYAACDARFSAMLGAGAMDEVRALLARGLDPSLPALRAVGVRELGAVIQGETTLDQAADKARQATRNYAKRQLTWFRHQLAPDLTLDRGGAVAAADVLAILQN
ncbi:tRNA (adenosine(37)-N6)-dimethylallyltransferase MiaA [Thalassospiraceae bacterium LMO-SO8]|nr:tRNA (adenosine(37)-N6)-dimethylallyltransferase MiaA [Alphaproteobacteria bacterium LMO-S08]WND74682.1 tRNA (adenosine(37)-N6)-dimethylallyltransferase MiaA [Thalassospiraceae bacterium LMO-SO8]